VVTQDTRNKAKALAYVLWNEFGARQNDIARVLSVSEPTISLWLKEMRLRAEIHQLGSELQEARAYAQALLASGKFNPPPPPFGGFIR
jgi:predicted transcriptional regulator